MARFLHRRLTGHRLCDALTWMFVILQIGLAKGFVDFHFVSEPSDTVVIKDSFAVLDCAVTGEPPAEIQWRREGNYLEFSGDERRKILSNGSLYFQSVHHTRTERPDEGLYQCLASLKGLGTILSRSAKLQIASLPKFDQQPRSLSLLPSQTAYFPCSIQAIPPATIVWLKDEQPLQIDRSRMTLLPSGALEIDHTEKFDNGVYRCNASNIEKFRLSDAATLTVNLNYVEENRISAPHFLSAAPKSFVIIQGQPLTLDCVANGHPRPKIIWLKDGTTIDMADLDSRFLIVGSGSLHLDKVEENDSGTYMCRAENSEESIDSSINVIVHVPPKFVKRPVNKYVYEKDDIELECEVYGKPLPTVQWFKNGELLIQSHYFQLVKGSNLRILGVVNSDSGMYQCIASNPAGNIQSPVQLKVLSKAVTELITPIFTATTTTFAPIISLHPNALLGIVSHKDTPSAPQNLSAIIVSTRFVALSWKPPLKTNGNIFAYSVYFKESSSERERVLNTTRFRLEEVNVQALQPSTKYVFRVVAYNQHGPGLSSEALHVETQSDVDVPSVPLNLVATPLSATSVFVKWNSPKDTKGPVQHYIVYFMEDGTSEEREISTESTSQIIAGLKKYTEYSIWVTAFNENGAGGSTGEVTVRTYADVPSDSPQNVTLEAASSSSIIVRWEAPPKESQNGVITGYKIRYKIKSGRRPEIVTTDGKRRLYALTGLERGSQYNVKIAALSVNGTGPATDWLTCETYQNDLNESRVPFQPTALHARPFSTSIVITWSPPLNQSIMVRGYTIGWGIGLPDIYTKVLDGKQRHYKIENLTPSSEYVISLRAFNEVGDGIPVYDTVKTLANTAPEPFSPMMPPVGVKAIVLSSSTAVLYWTDTTLSRNQIASDNRYYTVRYSAHSQASSSKYKYFNSTDLNCMIDDLKPNTHYEFAVKVVKGRRESTWSLSVINTTQEAAPASPPRDLTIVPSEGDDTQVSLQWQPPKQPNGQITGYVIFYTTDNSQKDRDWVVEGIQENTMNAVLKGLTVDTTYYFKIQARNSKGYGPISSEISFHTSPGIAFLQGSVYQDNKGLTSSLLYIIIGCVSGGTLLIVVIVNIIICKRRRRFIGTKRSKNYMKNSAAKNKTMGRELVPPDLWIHHDQMELKSVDKTSCAENNMTVTPIQRNSQELGEEPLLSALDKKKSAYIGDPLSDDNDSRILDKCILKYKMRAKPIKIPLDVQKPLISNTVSPPSSSSAQNCDIGSGTLSRPTYPRTQYNISRTQNTGESSTAASTIDLTASVPMNLHGISDSYQPSSSGKMLENSASINFSPAKVEPPKIEPGSASGTLTKRGPPGHPLRSFSVPAPPPQSAPATPQPKHLDVTLQKPVVYLPTVHPAVLSSLHHHHHHPHSTLQPALKPHLEESASTADQVQTSWSSENLNQQVANLEGLMKDLNAMQESEFEC